MILWYKQQQGDFTLKDIFLLKISSLKKMNQ